ncbi:MAG: dihydrofolate reductase [Bacteroidota bacterium]
MKISIVVAAALDNAIGKNNELLWKLPADMQFFKNLTWGMPIIMGRKTFESMRSRPLPGRINIVITRDPSSIKSSGQVQLAASLETAIQLARDTYCQEAFIIGGGDVYRQAMSMTDRIYMTRVENQYPDADTHFIEMDETNFQLIDSSAHPADEKHAIPFCFQTWERIS